MKSVSLSNMLTMQAYSTESDSPTERTRYSGMDKICLSFFMPVIIRRKTT